MVRVFYCLSEYTCICIFRCIGVQRVACGRVRISQYGCFLEILFQKFEAFFAFSGPFEFFVLACELC